MGQVPYFNTINDLHLIHLGTPALIFAVALYVLLSKIDHWLTFPLTLLSALLIFYGIFYATGQSFDEVSSGGWLPLIKSAPGIMFPVITSEQFSQINWLAIATQTGGILIVANRELQKLL